MYLLINFVIPIIVFATATEVACLLTRSKENGGARLVFTSGAFMPKYAELNGTKGREPLFSPFTDRHHSLPFQVMTLSGASSLYRPDICCNGLFGISSMFSSYFDLRLHNDIEDLEKAEKKFFKDYVDEYYLSYFPKPDKYEPSASGLAIMQCSAVFNLKALLTESAINPTSYYPSEIEEIIEDFVKNILSGYTIDIPGFVISRCDGGAAVLSLYKGKEPYSLPLGECIDEQDASTHALAKADIALAETDYKPEYIDVIDKKNVEKIPSIINKYLGL